MSISGLAIQPGTMFYYFYLDLISINQGLNNEKLNHSLIKKNKKMKCFSQFWYFSFQCGAPPNELFSFTHSHNGFKLLWYLNFLFLSPVSSLSIISFWSVFFLRCSTSLTCIPFLIVINQPLANSRTHRPLSCTLVRKLGY